MGEKRLVLLFLGGGPLNQGAPPWLISPPSSEFWLRHWELLVLVSGAVSTLTKYQCAFRKARSTMDHVLPLESHIRDGFIHHSNSLAVFLDIKSAYNLVSPTVLLHRLHYLGF